MYQHTVQYYETDKMGITHHSNYVRWMEEARINFLETIGFPFAKMEETGLISPIVSIDCKYKKTTTFSDVVNIEINLKEFKGVKLILEYIMTNQAGEVVFIGESVNCFLDKDARPLQMKRSHPDFYEAVTSRFQ